MMGANRPLTALQLQDGISNHLSQSGSQLRLGTWLLAPNSLKQYGHIRERMRDMMVSHQFLAHICGPPGNHPIARIYVLVNREKTMTGEHYPPLPVDDGGVAVFD